MAGLDVKDAIQPDVLPAIGSLVLPGTVAAAPWIALVWGPPHNLKTFVDANQGVSAAAGVLLVIGVGLLVDSIGTFVESHVVDSWHKDAELLRQRWTEYLKIAWVREPIGQSYLRRVLMAFKFELNLLIAALATFPGTLLLGYYKVVPVHAAFWTLSLTLVFAVYLAYAVRVDSDLLHRLRCDLLDVAREQNPKPTPRIVME